MRVDVILTWAVLAVIAGVLYTSPKYILDKAMEGFRALTGKQITELRTLLDTPYYGESSKGVKSIPNDINDGSSNSVPATADTQNCKSLSDGQGALLNAKKEQRNCPKPTVIYKTQTQYVPAPAKECPDLRDFIRKDQIPCWNCKP
jgi:hypothetical protein